MTNFRLVQTETVCKHRRQNLRLVQIQGRGPAWLSGKEFDS